MHQWPVSALLFIAGSQFVSLLTFWLLSWLTSPHLDKPTNADKLAHELLLSHEQYYSLYEQSPVPYITIDYGGKVTSYNLAAVRLLDTNKVDLVGETFADFLVEHDDGRLSVLLGKLGTEYPIVDEDIQIKTSTGALLWVRLSVFTYERTKQQLISLIDITEQKKIDTAKTEFVALATHQLRTPITAIRWNVELLGRSARDQFTEKQGIYLEKISRNVNRMIELINDFLSVSKLETGTFATSDETIILDSYLASVADEYAGNIAEKGITLQTNAQPTGFSYTVDRRLFHIIASNLLSNAIKYTHAGGTVTWGYTVLQNELSFTVSDTGIGIPAQEQSRLFSKFFRASNAQQHVTEGTGLGLYAVQQSVLQLGGTITITSKEGEGTSFCVTLPVVQ